jgi:ankyrin repeat protein
MDTQNVQEEAAESDTVTYLRRGMISILDVIAVKLPDVFTAEILPKLDIKDTLNLAQVNKAYNAAVWSADGVRSLEAKIEAHMVKIGKKNTTTLPLYWAAKHGNVPAARALLESGEDVNKSVSDMTVLQFAVKQGQVAVVQALVEAGADVNKTAGDEHRTALYIAATVGQAPCVVELIKAGAHVKNGGCTPLFAAIIYGHEAIVGMLILAGADGGEEYGPLIAWAKKYKHENIVKVLEQFGA